MHRWKVSRLAVLVTAGLAGVFVATSALAQSVMASGTAGPAEQLLTDQFNVDLGAFVIKSDINGNLRGNAPANGGIDFSHDFGSDADQTRWRANFLWRITPRQGLRFSYFDNDVTKTRNIDRQIDWGNYSFALGTSVTAETKFTIYELGYEWTFMSAPNYKVAGTFGIHVEDFKLALSGNATLYPPNGGPPQSVSGATESNSVTAPLPVLGIRGDYAATDNWYLDGGLQVFKFSYEGINGNWSDFNAGVTYMFSEHFGIGLAYDRFAVHVDLSKGAFNGRLNLGYQGGLLFVRAGF